MKIAVACVLAVAGWAAVHAQQTPAPAPSGMDTGTGIIAGQVIDAETRQGIPGAIVNFIGTMSVPAGRVETVRLTSTVKADSQGRFVFTRIPAAKYSLQAMLDGYSGAAGTATIAGDLADGKTIPDIRLRLTRLGSISGTVRDDGGDAVVGAEVLAFMKVISQSRPPAMFPAGRTRTDDRGQYRLVALAPGDYLVCACAQDLIPFDGQLLTTLASRPLDLLGIAGRAARVGADAASLDQTLRTFPPTFHPNTTLAGRAPRVKVSGAEPRANVDITLTPVEAVRVSGRVVGLPGSSLVAGAIRLIPVEDTPETAGLTQMAPILVQPDGRFDFARVAPGQYTLDVRLVPGGSAAGPSGAALAFIGGRTAPPGPRGGGPPPDPLWASLPVSVGDTGIADLIVGLQEGVAVSGRIEFEGGVPPPIGPPEAGRPSGIQLISLEPPPRNRTYLAEAAADGKFRAGGVVPGRYLLGVFFGNAFWSVKAVTLSGADISDTVLDVDGNGLSNLVMTLTRNPMAEVRGTVIGDARGQDEGTWIRMFPVDRKLWEEPYAAATRFKSVPVEGKTFNVTRVPAGEYYVMAANEAGWEWMEKARLDVLSRSAERIQIVHGEKKVIEVRR
jgi:hypothetical protein